MSPDCTTMPWHLPGPARNEQLVRNVSGLGKSLREMVLSVRGTVQVIENHQIVPWSPDADDPVNDVAEYDLEVEVEVEVEEEEEEGEGEGEGDVGDDPRIDNEDIPSPSELPSPTGITSLLVSLPRVTSNQFEIPAHLEAEETDNEDNKLYFAADEEPLAATDDLLEPSRV